MHPPFPKRRRTIFAAILVTLAAVAIIYAVAIALAEGIGAAGLPTLLALLFCFNCWLFLTGKAFPPKD
jgi:hypothetical protein